MPNCVFCGTRADSSVIELPSGNPVYISRVLDVIKGQLCYIVGTVYMEMPLKPNVLADIGKDVSLYGNNISTWSCTDFSYKNAILITFSTG